MNIDATDQYRLFWVSGEVRTEDSILSLMKDVAQKMNVSTTARQEVTVQPEARPGADITDVEQQSAEAAYEINWGLISMLIGLYKLVPFLRLRLL